MAASLTMTAAAVSSEAMRAATKRPADAAAVKTDSRLLDGVRLHACLAALLEAVLDEGACRDRVHDALIRIVAYCDEATDAMIAGGAQADGEEICGAEDHDRGVPNPWGAAWKSKFRAPHVDNLPNSLLDFHTGGEPHVGSV